MHTPIQSSLNTTQWESMNMLPSNSCITSTHSSSWDFMHVHVQVHTQGQVFTHTQIGLTQHSIHTQLQTFPESTTNLIPSMVIEVSAMFVEITHFRTSSGATSNTWTEKVYIVTCKCTTFISTYHIHVQVLHLLYLTLILTMHLHLPKKRQPDHELATKEFETIYVHVESWYSNLYLNDHLYPQCSTVLNLNHKRIAEKIPSDDP